MTNDDAPSQSSYFTPMDRNLNSCERTCAELRIYLDDEHPSTVTTMLGIFPTRQVAQGEKGPTNSLGRSPVGSVNGWFLSSEREVDSKDVRHHLDWLLAKLKPSELALHKLQMGSGVRMYVNCPWWSRHGSGGPTLWPEQMLLLAELNLECAFDFADYSDDEEQS